MDLSALWKISVSKISKSESTRVRPSPSSFTIAVRVQVQSPSPQLYVFYKNASIHYRRPLFTPRGRVV